MEFLPRTLFYYMLSHAYLFWHLYLLLRRNRPVLWLSLPFFLLMAVFPYAYHLLPPGGVQEFFGLVGSFWLPLAFFSLMVFVVLDGVALVAVLLRRVFPKALLLFFSRRLYLALFLLLAGTLYAYGIYEARNVRVTFLTLASERLPQGTDRLRIAFASDLHIGPQTGTALLRRSVDLILEQQPDLILLGGDILDDAFQGTPADMRELQRLRAPLGSFAVLGNHDAFGDYRHAEATVGRAGITLLSDQAVDLGPVRVVGFDDPLVTAQKEGPKTDALALLGQPGRDLYTVILDHRPVIRPETTGLFDLQLSGHSHGGQILPLKYALESTYGSPTGFSIHESPQGASALFVTTGTGFSKLPIRLFVPPEIVVMDIVRSEASGSGASGPGF